MDANTTVALHEVPSRRLPRFATPARRIVHTLIGVAGWVLFFYWWSIVLRQATRASVTWTGLFLLISLVVVVLTTTLWTWHNKRLHERKGLRTRVREVVEDYSHDVLGRPVRIHGSREHLQGQAEVEVVLEDGVKTYRPGAAARIDAPQALHGGKPA